jgi:hypothetical protein
MTKIDRPVEPETVACEICMKEVPASEAKTAEGTDYVLHFCGLDCFAKWQEQAQREEGKP